MFVYRVKQFLQEKREINKLVATEVRKTERETEREISFDIFYLSLPGSNLM